MGLLLSRVPLAPVCQDREFVPKALVRVSRAVLVTVLLYSM